MGQSCDPIRSDHSKSQWRTKEEEGCLKGCSPKYATMKTSLQPGELAIARKDESKAWLERGSTTTLSLTTQEWQALNS